MPQMDNMIEIIKSRFIVVMFRFYKYSYFCTLQNYSHFLN